jgi:hypothetical protein
MAHYALYAHPKGSRLRILEESLIELEEQLQEVLKENPSLLPAADLGLQSPLLVVGRESSLTSGYADLVCVDGAGMPVIVEVKRGKEGDARRAIAQALDYGSDIWHAVREGLRSGREATGVFEEAIALPYFRGERYPHSDRPGSLREAAEGLWGRADEQAEWWEVFETNLESTLISGKYSYVVFAPQIPDNVRTTVEYLSATANFSFAAVEVDHFADASEDFELYVPRAVAVPPPISKPPAPSRPTAHISRDQWLATLTSDTGRNFFRELTTRLEEIAGVELVFTEAGYFGVVASRPWGDGSIKLWLSDSYSAGSGRGLFTKDVLRLGYAQGTLDPFKRALDPWIDGLVSEFGAQEMRATQSRYARWDIPDDGLDAAKIAETIKQAVQTVLSVSEQG